MYLVDLFEYLKLFFLPLSRITFFYKKKNDWHFARYNYTTFPHQFSIKSSIADENSKRYSLGGLDGGRSGHDHKYAVNQYRGDDEEGKERVNQYVNGHTSYWIERIEHPHRVRRWKPEYVLSFANDDEGLQTDAYFKIHY